MNRAARLKIEVQEYLRKYHPFERVFAYLEGLFNGGLFVFQVWGAYIWRGLYMEGLTFGIIRYLSNLVDMWSLYVHFLTRVEEGLKNFWPSDLILSDVGSWHIETVRFTGSRFARHFTCEDEQLNEVNCHSQISVWWMKACLTWNSFLISQNWV